MSKKYVIEIKPEYEDTTKGVVVLGAKDSTLYVDTLSIEELEELNSDYINEHYGQLQDEAYQRGLEDAWEAARKIVVDTDHGGLALGTLSEIFGMQSYSCIMRENTAQEAIAKLKAYEDGKHSDRIEVGDMVDVYGNLGVVTYMYELKACVMMCDGSTSNWNLTELTKTGEHYDIQSILEAMRTND